MYRGHYAIWLTVLNAVMSSLSNQQPSAYTEPICLTDDTNIHILAKFLAYLSKLFKPRFC